METFVTSNWSLELCKNWKVELTEDSCFSFFCPDGYGVLQISSYLKNNSITTEDIIDLAEFSYEEKKYITEAKCGEFDGLQLEYSCENQIFWRKFWLKNDSLFLFVTYNCRFEYKEYETSLVNKMLLSLKVVKT